MSFPKSSPLMVIRVHPWVLWWFYLGVVCGVVAMANILLRNLTRTQEHILLLVGALHWLLGGLVCWASEGIRTEKPVLPRIEKLAETQPMNEWHPASDFLPPGGGHTLLSPRQHPNRGLLEAYILQHREQGHHHHI